MLLPFSLPVSLFHCGHLISLLQFLPLQTNAPIEARPVVPTAEAEAAAAAAAVVDLVGMVALAGSVGAEGGAEEALTAIAIIFKMHRLLLSGIRCRLLLVMKRLFAAASLWSCPAAARDRGFRRSRSMKAMRRRAVGCDGKEQGACFSF
jgi:hypothetical protein